MKIISICLLFTLIIISCDKQAEHTPVIKVDSVKGFTLPNGFEHSVYTVESFDLNYDSYKDAIVILHDTAKTHKLLTNDTLLIYTYNKSDNEYNKIQEILISNFESLSINDINRDKIPELLVSTNNHGNSIIASSGLMVYTLKDKEYSLFRDMPYGKPTVMTLDTLTAFLVHDQYSGFFSKQASAVYLDSIIFTNTFSTKGEYMLARNRILREVEDSLRVKIDTLMAHPVKGSTFQYNIFALSLNRVMILRKLDRNTEADEFTREVSNEKVVKIPRKYKDILDDTRMEVYN